ncbi:beta strand repeat-containing protein [Gimesia aquarii]|uniref:Uncharacterized protein n=1 Tax=Gimesia aquarii TaxID=2527964 RepID=A0A517WYN5_9PLAN|nr:hypothetical protein [Gimesia aquarii]QDU10366.1 hypothetical protein V202x_37650 [Gimesia aquarii]
MLIINWLNAFSSRLHFRPRYNYRARRAMRRRMQKKAYLNPPAVIEQLEVRQMLTSTLFLDFGAGFTGGELHTTVEDYLEIDGTGTGNGTGPNLDGLGTGSNYLGLTDDLVFKSLNYDFDGNATVNTADLTALANAVVPLIERALEPFDIDVVIASATNFTDVQTTLGLNDLDASGEFDAYVFVTEIWSTVFGNGTPGNLGSVGDTLGLYGIAAASDLFTNTLGVYSQGNQYDEAAHTFIDTIFDDTTGTSGTAAFNANLSQRIAYTATHEAFHTFSAIHTTDSLDAGDVIELGSATREDPFMVTRFDLNRQGGTSVTTKNNYELIASDSDIGLRDTDSDGTPDLAYVTGTGGHDQITLTDAGSGIVSVTVNAYSDAARTMLVGTDSYTIDLSSDTEGEILIDAGIGDDEIIIDASIEASFRVRGNIGDDTLVVDISNGLASTLGDINFDAEGDGGSIVLDQGSYVGTIDVTHTLNTNSSGSITINGQVIGYTNTESIIDNLTSSTLRFDFMGSDETVTLSDYGTSTDGLSTIDSTMGASVRFLDTSFLIVTTNLGSGADVITVQGLDSLLDENIGLAGDANDDVNLQATNLSLTGSYGFSAFGRTITVDSQISNSGSANILLSATRNLILNNNSSLITVDGVIFLDGNFSGTTTGTFIGIEANNATIQSTGTGDISLLATGGNQTGIYLHSGTTVSSTASGAFAGTITIEGTAGTASIEQHGILLISASVSSVDGNISLTGQGGGDGTGNNNVGLYLDTSSITSTGTGVNAATITANGTGGNGVSINRGIRTYDLNVTSVDGDITLIGQGAGTVAGSSNEGIVLGGATTSVTSTGAGADAANIIITGNAGSGATYNQGLYVAPNLAITSNAGDISVTTQGNILLDTSSDLQSTSGAIQVTTTYLNSDNTGNLTVNGGTISSAGLVSANTSSNILLNSGSSVTTVDGGITLQANSAGTTAGTFIGIEANNATIQTTGVGNVSLTAIGENKTGIYLYGNTAVSSTASGASAGTISLNGTAGTASIEQHGILLISASVLSVDGNISLTGQGGGDGTGNNNVGLYLDTSSITSTGTGVNAATITANGTGGNGVSINRGIRTYDLNVTSVDGDITLIGQGAGTVAGSSNEGIVLGGATTSVTSTGAGADAANIIITGNAGSGATYNQGLYVAPNLAITSNAGDISVTSNGDAFFGSSSEIGSSSGNVEIFVNYLSASNLGILTMNAGVLFDAGSGNIDLDVDDDVLLAGLTTTGTVTIDSANGSILDNDDTDLDIVAGTGTLTAAGSIGLAGNLLDTSMGSYTAVSGISDVNINNI